MCLLAMLTDPGDRLVRNDEGQRVRDAEWLSQDGRVHLFSDWSVSIRRWPPTGRWSLHDRRRLAVHIRRRLFHAVHVRRRRGRRGRGRGQRDPSVGDHRPRPSEPGRSRVESARSSVVHCVRSDWRDLLHRELLQRRSAGPAMSQCAQLSIHVIGGEGCKIYRGLKF